MREVFAGDVIEAGTRYQAVTVDSHGVEERRYCYAALTWRIPESDMRFFIEETP